MYLHRELSSDPLGMVSAVRWLFIRRGLGNDWKSGFVVYSTVANSRKGTRLPILSLLTFPSLWICQTISCVHVVPVEDDIRN